VCACVRVSLSLRVRVSVSACLCLCACLSVCTCVYVIDPVCFFVLAFVSLVPSVSVQHPRVSCNCMCLQDTSIVFVLLCHVDNGRLIRTSSRAGMTVSVVGTL
jgi:hypothetical protein